MRSIYCLVRALLLTFSWQELRHHPWRTGVAMVAVMLGVALAFAVALINASALGEFSQAVQAVSGQPDLELRAVRGGFDEQVYARVAADPRVAVASPVLETTTQARASGGTSVGLRVLGVDALRLAAVAPALQPRPYDGADRFAIFAPESIFLNAAARTRLGLQDDARAGQHTLQLQQGLGLRSVRVSGSVASPGTPLAVMDIGAAQDLFERPGVLTRIDIRLQAGTDAQAFVDDMQAHAGPGGGWQVVRPGDDAQRIEQLSRAYRVNLSVLALVALFTGAFLVFSVTSLGVARRAQQFALLGVLGLTARERARLVLTESLLLGVVGSAAGIAMGAGLAWGALHALGGDLGGGYFPGVSPRLRWDGWTALGYGALGTLASLVGAWIPARAAERLPPAQTLKGLEARQDQQTRAPWIAASMIAAGILLALAPPIGGIALPAYVAIGLLLIGGIAALPGLIGLVNGWLAPLCARRLLPMLAIERARRVQTTAAVAVSGVVASLSLSVALTVMVTSFRASVTQWLDVVVPADLYVRGSGATSANDAVWLPPAFVEAAARVPGVERVRTQRTASLLLEPGRPAVALIARALDDPARTLPLVGDVAAVPPGAIAIYVSEAMVHLYGARPGEVFTPLGAAWRGQQGDARFVVAGVWRDYVRQFGAITLDTRDYLRLTGDTRVNDLALWLAPEADASRVQSALRESATQQAPESASLLAFASAREIRATSLRIFDRSFAVTWWLQAVAIVIGLFGVAASFSAQVLARRKEFGLLMHLGLTRGQIRGLVAAEGLAWTTVGALAGLGLGLAVSVVLIHVVNPQSFHWSMDLLLPWPRLLLLCCSTVAAGAVTAWVAARAAAGSNMVMAVKEDW